MVKRAPLVDSNGEAREIIAQGLATLQPAHPVFTVPLQEAPGIPARGPKKEQTKISTKIFLDQKVLQALKATGPGWQSRLNDHLRAAIKSGRLKRKS